MELLYRNFVYAKNIIKLLDQIIQITVINDISCPIYLLNNSSFCTTIELRLFYNCNLEKNSFCPTK